VIKILIKYNVDVYPDLYIGQTVYSFLALCNIISKQPHSIVRILRSPTQIIRFITVKIPFSTWLLWREWIDVPIYQWAPELKWVAQLAVASDVGQDRTCNSPPIAGYIWLCVALPIEINKFQGISCTIQSGNLLSLK
jgi:hypothetical protein